MTHTLCIYLLSFGLNRWKITSFTAEERGKAALSVNESFILKESSGLARIGVNPLKVAYIALEEKEWHRKERESQFMGKSVRTAICPWWSSHINILNLIISAESLLPFKITVTSSKVYNLDVFGGNYLAYHYVVLFV